VTPADIDRWTKFGFRKSLYLAAKTITTTEIIDGNSFLMMLGNRAFLDQPYGKTLVGTSQSKSKLILDSQSTTYKIVLHPLYYANNWTKQLDLNDNRQIWSREMIFTKSHPHNLGRFYNGKSCQSLPGLVKDAFFIDSVNIDMSNAHISLLCQLLLLEFRLNVRDNYPNLCLLVDYKKTCRAELEAILGSRDAAKTLIISIFYGT
jgi:hypothetical protein